MSYYNTLLEILEECRKIQEIAVVPQESLESEFSPFHVVKDTVNNAWIVGISAKVIPGLYTEAFQRFKQCHSIDAAKVLLLINPENLDAWNCLRKAAVAGNFDWTDFNQILSRHPATLLGWSFRRWLRDLSLKNNSYHLQKDLDTALIAAERKAANYFAWTDRITLIPLLQSHESEIDIVRRFIQKHVTDRSAFCYYEALLQKHCPEDTLEFAFDMCTTFPGHETIWYHLRFLGSFKQNLLPLISDYITKQIQKTPVGIDADVTLRQSRLATSTLLWFHKFHNLVIKIPLSDIPPFYSESL